MDKKNSLSDEWKDCAYNIGGALVGLGKITVRSIKAGVDMMYDKINEEDSKNKSHKSNEVAKQNKATKPAAKDVDDEWDEL